MHVIRTFGLHQWKVHFHVMVDVLILIESEFLRIYWKTEYITKSVKMSEKVLCK